MIKPLQCDTVLAMVGEMDSNSLRWTQVRTSKLMRSQPWGVEELKGCRDGVLLDAMIDLNGCRDGVLERQRRRDGVCIFSRSGNVSHRCAQSMIDFLMRLLNFQAS